MDNEQQNQLLKDVMIILDDLFYRKCSNSDLVIEFPTHDKEWMYLHPDTQKELKKQLIKYKMRIAKIR